jgi:hypothetical protein
VRRTAAAYDEMRGRTAGPACDPPCELERDQRAEAMPEKDEGTVGGSFGFWRQNRKQVVEALHGWFATSRRATRQLQGVNLNLLRQCA